MKATTTPGEEESVVIGNASNFWRYSTKTGFDLTRQTDDRTCSSIHLKTATAPITIDPARSALVIIDMQNFFLHPSVRSHAPGLDAAKQLLDNAIPAAREAGIQVIWLNWGLTQEDVDQAPPGLKRAFASDNLVQPASSHSTATRKLYRGFGTEMGEIVLPNGDRVDGGRLLMRETWNARLYDPLLLSCQNSQTTAKPDQCFHKNRISGLWTDQSPFHSYLQANKLVTLLFGGVNTDQCVVNTVEDAFSKGFDCILLRDGCGTLSPSFARECTEHNYGRGLGFMIDTERFAEGVHSSLRYNLDVATEGKMMIQ